MKSRAILYDKLTKKYKCLNFDALSMGNMSNNLEQDWTSLSEVSDPAVDFLILSTSS